MEETLNEFRKRVLKLNGPRKHKVRNSLGAYDAYKYIRKNKWFNIGRPVTEHEFYTIIRQVNNLLAEEILQGHEIILPHGLGKIELRKDWVRMAIKNGVLRTNLPVDWYETIKLWFEDKEAYKKKTLIRMEKKELFKIFYNKSNANYKNKSFMEFLPNRDLMSKLAQKIKEGIVDTIHYLRPKPN